MGNGPAKLDEMWIHISSMQRVIPTGAVPVTVTSAGGAWTLGAFSNDIAAANAIPVVFMIHYAVISGLSANAAYEMVIYCGATDVECARISCVRSGVQTASFTTRCQTDMIPADSRLRAKLMDSVGGGTADVSIYYHYM